MCLATLNQTQNKQSHTTEARLPDTLTEDLQADAVLVNDAKLEDVIEWC